MKELGNSSAFESVLSCVTPASVASVGSTCRKLQARVTHHGGCHACIVAIFPPLQQPGADYMKSLPQPEINCNMRTVLVDWLVDVHTHRQALSPPRSVLHRAVDVLDAHLAKHVVSRSQLQHLGSAALAEALGQWRSGYLDTFATLVLNAVGGVAASSDPAPGYDYWTRLMVGMSACASSLEEVHRIRRLVEASGRPWLSRLTAACHTRRLADLTGLPPEARRASLLLSDYMLFNLSFRRWSPEARGASCIIVAALALAQLERAKQPGSESRDSASGVQFWFMRAAAKELARAANFPDGLDSCAEHLVKFMMRTAVKSKLIGTYKFDALERKDAETVQQLRSVSWRNLMLDVKSLK